MRAHSRVSCAKWPSKCPGIDMRSFKNDVHRTGTASLIYMMLYVGLLRISSLHGHVFLKIRSNQFAQQHQWKTGTSGRVSYYLYIVCITQESRTNSPTVSVKSNRQETRSLEKNEPPKRTTRSWPVRTHHQERETYNINRKPTRNHAHIIF